MTETTRAEMEERVAHLEAAVRFNLHRIQVLEDLVEQLARRLLSGH